MFTSDMDVASEKPRKGWLMERVLWSSTLITKVDGDRSLYQSEFSTLGSYVNNLATKDFNGASLFDGVTRGVTIDSDANTFSMSGSTSHQPPTRRPPAQASPPPPGPSPPLQT